jgi:hypothetical protein
MFPDLDTKHQFMPGRHSDGVFVRLERLTSCGSALCTDVCCLALSFSVFIIMSLCRLQACCSATSRSGACIRQRPLAEYFADQSHIKTPLTWQLVVTSDVLGCYRPSCDPVILRYLDNSAEFAGSHCCCAPTSGGMNLHHE